MNPNPAFSVLASPSQIQLAVKNLTANGMMSQYVDGREDAKRKALGLIPVGAEVFAVTSRTLEQIGLTAEINESGRFSSIRKKLLTMDRATQGREMAKIGATPEWVVGSVHALTIDGKLLIASNTGSQLSSEASAAAHVLFIVGAQKIVNDMELGIRRIYEYCLPLEDARMRAVAGRGSSVGKILIINKEIRPDRIHVIIVGENLGF